MSLSLHARIFFFAASLILTTPALANISTTGDVTPAHDGSDPWLLDTDLNLATSPNTFASLIDQQRITGPKRCRPQRRHRNKHQRQHRHHRPRLKTHPG